MENYLYLCNTMDKTFIKELLFAPSPSGYESAARNVFLEHLVSLRTDKGLVKYEFTDSIGNCAVSVGSGDVAFMVSGHIDEIALQVQYIDDDGFIHFIKDGGIDPKSIVGKAVTIINDKFPEGIKGVIGKKPIHIEYGGEDKDKAIKMTDMKIDIGAESKEDAMKFVEVGNPIIISKNIFDLPCGNRIAGNGLDDKLGVAVTAEVIKRLAPYNLKNLKVYGVACTQEEVGGYGAHIAAKRINPAYSIDYDVTFATDDGLVDKKEWGDIKLGKGGAIAFGPDKNIDMCKQMIRICESRNIPYQTFSVRAGMTNTLKIKMASDDAKTMLLSIPNRNMHTPVEVCDYRDLDSIVNMTVAYILWLENYLSKNKK